MTPFQKARADLDAAQPQMDRSSAIADEITLERLRQVEREGYSPEHDDAHGDGGIARAAAAYALASTQHTVDPEEEGEFRAMLRALWPWRTGEFKPGDQRRDLVRAAALLVAEIERLDRAAAKQ